MDLLQTRELLFAWIYLGQIANAIGLCCLLWIVFDFKFNPSTTHQFESYVKSQSKWMYLQSIIELVFPFLLFIRFVIIGFTINMYSTYSKQEQLKQVIKADKKFNLFQ